MTPGDNFMRSSPCLLIVCTLKVLRQSSAVRIPGEVSTLTVLSGLPCMPSSRRGRSVRFAGMRCRGNLRVKVSRLAKLSNIRLLVPRDFGEAHALPNQPYINEFEGGRAECQMNSYNAGRMPIQLRWDQRSKRSPSYRERIQKLDGAFWPGLATLRTCPRRYGPTQTCASGLTSTTHGIFAVALKWSGSSSRTCLTRWEERCECVTADGAASATHGQFSSAANIAPTVASVTRRSCTRWCT